MARVPITEKIWYDPEVKSYVMLDVTDDIEHPQSILISDSIRLQPKDEYHCTLVAAGKLSENPAVVEAVIGDISEYLQSNPVAVTFEGVGTDYYFCQKDGESTLIVSAIITGLAGLRDVVRRTLPNYDDPQPHVTLLKSENSPYGIGVNSPEDLKRLCQKIEMPVELYFKNIGNV